MSARLCFSLALFVGSMLLGWWAGRRGLLTESRAAALIRLVVVRLSPLVLALLFWGMDFRSRDPWLLPFIGLAVCLSTLPTAWLYARRARLSRPETGSFLTCAFFSNVGYLGAFTAFALFGEAAYGLCVLYFLAFTPCFYTIGFGLAARYGHAHQRSKLSSAYNDSLRLYPFLGMMAGVLLNVAGLPRPGVLQGFNHVLIPLDTALYLTAIGSQLRFESPRPWLRSCLAMSAIKFVASPLVAWALVTAFGLTGLTRIVVLLEASTPVAVSPLVLPLLFGVDRKLANALWLFTTAWAVPWLLLILPLLQRL